MVCQSSFGLSRLLGQRSAHRVALPAGRLHDSGDCGPFHVRRRQRFTGAILAGAAAAETGSTLTKTFVL